MTSKTTPNRLVWVLKRVPFGPPPGGTPPPSELLLLYTFWGYHFEVVLEVVLEVILEVSKSMDFA